MSCRPYFLVTNDDGIDAAGIRALEEAASRHGDVVTVAPRTEMSATSHAITLHAPLRVLEMGPQRFAVADGTPVDCVYLGLNHLCQRRPTLVLSGVNMGVNIGHDVIYSGTVAAARQSHLMGVTGVAFSFATAGGTDLAEAVEPAATVIEQVLRELGDREPELLNVNIPKPGPEGLRGYVATVLGHRVFSVDAVRRQDPRGREYVWIGGSEPEMRDVPNSDCNAVRDGYVSVTPLQTDTTAHHQIEGLWGWKLFQE